MVGPELQISSELRLIAPSVERDAVVSVKWRSGEDGRNTQASMGIPAKDISRPTLDDERTLIRNFIDTKDEIVWMIECDEQIVGAVEVHLVGNAEIQSPNVSIMIGETRYRGKGIGRKVMRTVIQFLISNERYTKIYARYLVANVASEKMNRQVGFRLDGPSYIDENGLEWQNVIYD